MVSREGSRSRSGSDGARKSGLKSPRTGSLRGTNNLRRFGASIKRIVREVEENNPVDENRDVLVTRHVLLNVAKNSLHSAYLLSLNTLVCLHNKYLESKHVKNIFNRYALLRAMVKDLVLQESKWWPHQELPTQNRAESVSSFTVRAAAVIEKISNRCGDKTKLQLEERKNAIEEKVIEMTSSQLNDENSTIANEFYKLLKKYQGIRNIIKTINKEYLDSKIYPIFPRYILLKDMIKDATHHPDYKEVSHEADATIGPGPD